MTQPNYVYKIVPSSSPPPDELPDSLPVSDLDHKSGFIHLSTATQIPGTLKVFFKDDAFVFILRIKYGDVADKIRWEDPNSNVCGSRDGEGEFPHLYNGLKLGKNEIDRVEVLEKGQDGWDTALARANNAWLIW